MIIEFRLESLYDGVSLSNVYVIKTQEIRFDLNILNIINKQRCLERIRLVK
jgi:hypothetical protein